MFTLRHGLLIQAPIGLCFALSTHLRVVERVLGMHPVEGRTAGLVTAGDTVRWEGMRFGFANYHVSLVPPDTWNPPHFFQARMITGRFRSFEHDHSFVETANGTFLDDCIRFTMPFGRAGDLVGRAAIVPHILGLMRRRLGLLKCLAETDEWRDYLPALDIEPHLSSPNIARPSALPEARLPAQIHATLQSWSETSSVQSFMLDSSVRR